MASNQFTIRNINVMKKIVRATSMGYCMGVERAIKIAEENLEKQDKLTSLGLLIHNEIENSRLASLGLEFTNLDDLSDNGNGASLLIRAHGLDPHQRDRLMNRGYNLIDATCPLVAMNQRDVRMASNEGYYVVIVGKPQHAEIIAMQGFADSSRLKVISSIEEARNLVLPEKILFVLSQTTLRPDLYADIKNELAQRYILKEYRPSICPATQERQKAVKELASQVDAVVVVGDSNSANTKGLQESVLNMNVPAYMVAEVSQLDISRLKTYDRIGLTAGASVPGYVIDAVERKLQEYLE